MAKNSLWILWPIACGLLLGLLIIERNNPPQQPAGFADAVAHASVSVANIYTTTRIRETRRNPFYNDPLFRHFFGDRQNPVRERLQRSLGSAVVVSKAGYLLTNYHVIKGADEILVSLHDGRQALGEIVGSDADTDLAVIKIDLDNLQPAQIGDPTQARVGDIVLAIGNPYGFNQSVTQGIISATDRYGLGINEYENFIQTDAAINPGNSGGALIDTTGKLIGINTAIYTQSGGSMGIGLAIPADLALRTMRDLIEFGRPMRGWLGIEVVPVTGGGVGVSRIATGSPAHQSGLRPGDILRAINKRPITSAHQGMRMIADARPGDVVELDVQRGNERLTISATLATRPTLGNA